MKRHQISIQARFRPETLERVLRVARHRGFQVSAMNMTSQDDGARINIELTVTSQRPVDLLSTQLSKLLDISRIEIQSLRA
ncbi:MULTISPECIES: acetolactate synthase 2 small subunit [Lonsdalea]|uniref:Acetolactate synthase 2 regulatory subunit n=2 Tax=Lonsdalea TaxID=1082702 RepID=A0ACD1JF89_9GAMM|nr:MULTISPECIES: acetolactate synthase 2 small subunit [Lonsdalea]OSM95803.1 acetolactate synthase 2 regulatory subunit [Lonsdalea populi]OSM98195.1 acetolactate synthase 2 regulatory subunit [Lonsdalea populi]QPQ24396.1 acetolactate synthase 2 small subunit [Lonsdalea populi]RAT15135.1 acetolactate synthase 2 regulatory subunit [Lonsdalea quercina]RAT16098.1 acetolactate synthase 2 regulatory subunit [Lonsdalea quercina]